MDDPTNVWQDPVARAVLDDDQFSEMPELPVGSIDLSGLPDEE